MRALRASIDALVIGTACFAAFVALRTHEGRLAERSAVESTQAALSTIQAELGIRSALGEGSLNEFGHPESLDRGWFADVEPRNALAREQAPWIETALPGEFDRLHPSDPTFRGGRGAMFWYNPVRGVVRARVPVQTSDESSRALYATVNGEDWEP
jgi:hypothetical protein